MVFLSLGWSTPPNLSDFMLVEGYPGDKILKRTPLGRGPFDNKQRVFEFDVGVLPDIFGWGPDSHKEGHTKIPKSGKNVMAFLQRQASANNKMLVFMWTDDEACQLANKDYEKAKEKVLSVEKTEKLPTF